jgi:hypothetical protein
MEEEYKEEDLDSNKINYQYPKKHKKVKEEFEIVLVGSNFLIVKDGLGNNLRVKLSSSDSYKKGEKIYKEDGKFSWEMS